MSPCTSYPRGEEVNVVVQRQVVTKHEAAGISGRWHPAECRIGWHYVDVTANLKQRTGKYNTYKVAINM